MMKHKIVGSLLCLIMGCSAMPVAFAGPGPSKSAGPGSSESAGPASSESAGLASLVLFCEAQCKKFCDWPSYVPASVPSIKQVSKKTIFGGTYILEECSCTSNKTLKATKLFNPKDCKAR